MAKADAVRTKARKMQADLNASLIERDEEVSMCLRALFSNDHVLLVGVPGVAKSMLCESFGKWLKGGVYFEWLLSKFSVPEELFGSISVAGLQEDDYRRVTAHKMPEAHFVFLDEALDLETPVLTTDGWSTVGQLRLGDLLFGSDGNATAITGFTTIKTDAICYRVTFRDGESLICDAGHKWRCRQKPSVKESPWRVLTTEEMYHSGRRFNVPVPAPLSIPDASSIDGDLPVDPYVFGLWLGNGNCFSGELYIRRDLSKRTLEEIRRTMPEATLGRYTNDDESVRVISLAGTGFRTFLRQHDLINNKHSLAEFMLSPVNSRLRLLQGLMDTDGYMDAGGTCVFSNTNESVIDAVAFIVRSLGIVASKKLTSDDRVGAKGQHKPCWKVTFRADPGLSPFVCRNVHIPPTTWTRQNLIVSIEPVDSRPVRCVQVDADDHLFAAGTNMCMTHNCFKASSAILNTTLKILNERTFANGRTVEKCPLQLCLAASNEWPGEQEELGALFDRFLYRKNVNAIKTRQGLDSLLWTDNLEPKLTTTITPAEIETGRKAVQALPLSEAAREAFLHIVREVRTEGVFPGDRRLRKSVAACRASAWLDGADEVQPDHLEVLSDILWDDPQEQPLKVAQVVGKVANPVGMQVNSLLMEVEQILQGCDATDLAQAATATSKLQDVVKRLKNCGANGRAKKASDYVSGEIKRLKLAAVESL